MSAIVAWDLLAFYHRCVYLSLGTNPSLDNELEELIIDSFTLSKNDFSGEI